MNQSPRFTRLQRAARLAPLAVKHLIGEAADALYVHSGKRIDATRPRRIYGVLNERCNLKCLGCKYWRLPAYVQVMPAAQWVSVLAELRDFLGRYHINFSGGEPLPDRLIEADPVAYVRDVMGRRSAGLAPFDPRALIESTRQLLPV